MPLSDVHHCKGQFVAYVLRCDPKGTEYPALYYVGKTCDWERRILQHCGKSDGGAQFTKAHIPIDIESVHVCKSEEEATFMEVGLWNLLAAKHGHQAIRGGRHNMDCGLMKFPPRGWKEGDSPKDLPPVEPEPDTTSSIECPRDPTAKMGGIGLAPYFT